MTPQEVLKKFLVEEKGFNVDEDQGKGFNALMIAARSGKIKGVELLLDLGADPNAKDNYDWTPLHWASHYGKTEAIELLLKAGSDVDAKNNNGYTPLHLTSSNGKTEAIELLKRFGATE